MRFISDHDQSGGLVNCVPYEGDTIGVSYFLFRLAQWVLEHVP